MSAARQPSRPRTTPAAPDAVRVPPHALDAEMSVLGALLQDHDTFLRVRQVLAVDDFYRDAHRLIFSAAIAVAHDRGEVVDLVSVTNELRRAGRLEDAGSSAYLTNLVAASVTSAGVLVHAWIIKEKACARRCADLALRLQATALIDTGWRQVLRELVEAAPALLAQPDEARRYRRTFVTTPL